jgi:branched-chain amino acid transport system ATP-binding protein
LSILNGIGLNRAFGGVQAVRNLDFAIEEGQILGLIGPNGAGKTTLFNLIAGVFRPHSGTIRFSGEDITGLKPFQICHKGIGRTFQIVKPFNSLTVLENVRIGARFGKSPQILDRFDPTPIALEALEFVGLIREKDTLCDQLNLGDKKRVDLARVLSTQPRLILLDEVMAGLNPVETNQLMALVQKMRNEKGITIFMIEHVMKAVMGVSDWVVVMHHGEKIAEGPPETVVKDSVVIDAYLGERMI